MTYDFSPCPTIIIDDSPTPASPEVALQRGKFVAMLVVLGCHAAIAFPGVNSIFQNSVGILVRGGTPAVQKEATDKKQESVQTPPVGKSESIDKFEPSKDAPKFQKPLKGEIRVGSGYGMRIHPIKKVKQMHRGIDINPNLLDKKGNRLSTQGQPIFSVADGKVDAAAWLDSACGYGVKVKHSGGYTSIYCHASQLLVKPGQSVKAGEKIALVGSTGASTGPHLHLGMRLNGKWIDPKKVIPLK
jgi:murein DD-endopeptidase MepM/ murein hydrolase activator NlpD